MFCVVSCQSGCQAAFNSEVAILFDAAIRVSHNLHMSVAHLVQPTKTCPGFYGLALVSTDLLVRTNKHYFGIGIHDGCVGRASNLCYLCDDMNREM